MNALAVMDRTAKPSVELTRAIKAVGAQAFHKSWVGFMSNAGWRCGGGATRHDALMTPHMRRWSLLVDDQRKPLIEAGDAVIEAVWSDEQEQDNE